MDKLKPCDWEFLLYGVMFEGIAHKLKSGEPLTESQERLLDEWNRRADKPRESDDNKKALESDDASA